MRIHHIGAVVPRIEHAMQTYVDVLGLKQETPIVEDPIQRARLVMLADPAGGPGYELIEPLTEDSPVAMQAKRGVNPAHTCFEVDDIEAEIDRLQTLGARVVQSPAAACLFGGARVAFVFLRSRDLIELVEVGATGPEGWRPRHQDVNA